MGKCSLRSSPDAKRKLLHFPSPLVYDMHIVCPQSSAGVLTISLTRKVAAINADISAALPLVVVASQENGWLLSDRVTRELVTG